MSFVKGDPRGRRPDESGKPRPRILSSGLVGRCRADGHLGSDRNVRLLYLEGYRGELMCAACASAAVRSARVHFVYILVEVNREFKPHIPDSRKELVTRVSHRFNVPVGRASQIVSDYEAWKKERDERHKQA